MGFNPCCCMSSKIGGIIIAVLIIIASVLGLLTVVYRQVAFAQMGSLEDAAANESKQEMSKQYPGTENMSPKEFYSFVNTIQIYMLVTNIINLVIASLLIHGLRKERPKLIMTYLIVSTLLLFLSLAVTIFNETVFAMVGNLLGVVVYSLNLYSLCVVYAAYVKIRNSLSQEQDSNAKYEEP